ncbi:hypothetical protein KKA53_00690 [Candidatus Dependentiae bacterium]|nr:hypothetical protein [Candidatus Dependentiae bacterium]
MKSFKMALASVLIEVLFVMPIISMDSRLGDSLYYLTEIEKECDRLKKECDRLKKKCNRLLGVTKKNQLAEWEKSLKEREADLKKKEAGWENFLSGDPLEIYCRAYRQAYEEFSGEREKHVGWHRAATDRCNEAKKELEQLKSKKRSKL